jgi:hypothetical protein
VNLASRARLGYGKGDPAAGHAADGSQQPSRPLGRILVSRLREQVRIPADVTGYGSPQQLESADDEAVPVLRMGNIEDCRVDMTERVLATYRDGSTLRLWPDSGHVAWAAFAAPRSEEIVVLVPLVRLDEVAQDEQAERCRVSGPCSRPAGLQVWCGGRAWRVFWLGGIVRQRRVW